MTDFTRDLETSTPATTSSTLASTTPSADPIKQWESVLNVVIAANRFRDRSRVGAAPFDQEISDHEGSSRDRNGNSVTQSPVQVTTSHDPVVDPREYLRIVQVGLVQQLNAFGIVLTLLATVMSVAILQPPGSFDGDGHIRPYRLVACYLLFASLSFLLACTGLFAVIVGSASLYRPLFFPEPRSQRVSVRELTSQLPGFDNTLTLVSIIRDNLLRLRRLKTYLGFSLALGMTAYVCGAFAILGPGWRNLWMAVGTIAVSTVILLFEAGMTWTGPALPDDTLARLQQIVH